MIGLATVAVKACHSGGGGVEQATREERPGLGRRWTHQKAQTKGQSELRETPEEVRRAQSEGTIEGT